MSGYPQTLVQKIESLGPEQIAEVEGFVDRLFLNSGNRRLIRASADLSSASFGEIWNDPENDVYDAL